MATALVLGGETINNDRELIYRVRLFNGGSWETTVSFRITLLDTSVTLSAKLVDAIISEANDNFQIVLADADIFGARVERGRILA